MTKKDIIYLLITSVLLIAVVLISGQYYFSSIANQATQNTLKQYKYNDKVLVFTKLFISKILQAKTAVSFDDRLQLENAVRDINSKPIFDKWQKFTNATDPADAQQQVKDLLGLLMENINY